MNDEEKGKLLEEIERLNASLDESVVVRDQMLQECSAAMELIDLAAEIVSSMQFMRDEIFRFENLLPSYRELSGQNPI